MSIQIPYTRTPPIRATTPRQTQCGSIVWMLTVAAVLVVTLSTSKQAEAAERSLGPFSVKALELLGLSCALTIDVTEQEHVTLRILGSAKAINNVHTNMIGTTLKITQTRSTRAPGITVISSGQPKNRNSNSVTINGQTVVVQGSGGVAVVSGTQTEEQPEIHISMPADKSLGIHDFRGTAHIGTIHAPLTLETRGDVTIDGVHRAALAIAGNADVEIKHATEELSARVGGNGKLNIEQGSLSYVEVRAEDNGKVDVMGDADRAVLTATDNSTVFVKKVSKLPTVHASRNGRIHVGNW